MMILDDEEVEPPETFTVFVNATGPTDEYIDLFNVVRPQTLIEIVDNDSKYISVHMCACVVAICVYVCLCEYYKPCM